MFSYMLITPFFYQYLHFILRKGIEPSDFIYIYVKNYLVNIRKNAEKY